VRIGIDVPPNAPDGRLLDAAGVMRRATMIEDAGLDGIWNGDASYFRGVYTEVDPFQWMLLAAAATTRIELGLTVLQVPLREPVDLAQRLLTIHALAGGRFTAGVGAGSTRGGAFDAVGVSFEDRFKILHSHMSVIRRLLDGEQVGPAQIPPWPGTKGGPRFILGAWHSPLSLKRAVSEYDGWMSSSALTSLNVMAEGIKRYRDLGGQRAMTTTCRIDLRAPDTPLDRDTAFNLVCGPGQAAERLHQLAELGFDDVCLRFVDYREKPGLGRANFTADDLAEIRSLLPRDTRENPAIARTEGDAR
jgi:alkanesulfonate monooxygenase SsuD/methylene tetrahydromethanopterin reductase-like flavin-dependent oxidoreductase (luciferase family)